MKKHFYKLILALLGCMLLTTACQKEPMGSVVTFNSNGGAGTMGKQFFEEGVATELNANTFTRSGYTFSGWNTSSNGSGTAYSNQQTITITEDMTLYALWTQQSLIDQIITVNGVSFTMKPVQGGIFWMGAQSTDANEQNYDREADDDYECPVHQVTLSSFYMGETEVTQQLWLAVMGSWPGYAPSSTGGAGNNYPAYNVSWNDIQNFIGQLNLLTGRIFRLPTEAEWEYAARGGNQNKGCKYSGSYDIATVAWYLDNSSHKAHVVKTKAANELGLYDMSGNVFEWCSDYYGSYGSSSQTNPTGPTSGSDRVFRGGCYYGSDSYCRVAYRAYETPDYVYSVLGFRLALVP